MPKRMVGELGGDCPSCNGTVKKHEKTCINARRILPPDRHAEVDGWSRSGFIEYLRNTLIPDLRESGRIETAKDFETAIAFMERSKDV